MSLLHFKFVQQLHGFNYLFQTLNIQPWNIQFVSTRHFQAIASAWVNIAPSHNGKPFVKVLS